MGFHVCMCELYLPSLMTLIERDLCEAQFPLRGGLDQQGASDRNIRHFYHLTTVTFLPRTRGGIYDSSISTLTIEPLRQTLPFSNIYVQLFNSPKFIIAVEFKNNVCAVIKCMNFAVKIYKYFENCYLVFTFYIYTVTYIIELTIILRVLIENFACTPTS